ncbi:hypothetical protein N7517_010291 [Penicillium concentricum]|uniref:Uncharacterized protein n=1 Tax=Penicillium concentricum TaxID=293559 RepID=A0A9W9R8H9_9EURO|nr:uncharacterized protein N7517_010291 [Penicillium concentricum]KAJ5355682.1 hypothetical protein N7517_010291 [Penicillium concentricum]
MIQNTGREASESDLDSTEIETIEAKKKYHKPAIGRASISKVISETGWFYQFCCGQSPSCLKGYLRLQQTLPESSEGSTDTSFSVYPAEISLQEISFLVNPGTLSSVFPIVFSSILPAGIRVLCKPNDALSSGLFDWSRYTLVPLAC